MKKILALLLAGLILLPSECMAAGSSPENLKPVLAKATKRLNQWLGALDDDLQSAAQRLSTLDLNSNAARDVLKGLCIGRSYVIDAVIMDKAGKAIAVRTPENKIIDEKNLRAQEDAVQVEVTRKPAMSCEFRSTENTYVLVFEYPIFGDGRAYLGSVSLLVNQMDFLNNIIKPLIRGVPCAIWMMQTDGNIVYSEYRELVNKNLLNGGIPESTESLRSFAKNAAAGERGSGSYEFVTPGDGKDVVKRGAIWGTVGLYDSMWRVVVVDLTD